MTFRSGFSVWVSVQGRVTVHLGRGLPPPFTRPDPGVRFGTHTTCFYFRPHVGGQRPGWVSQTWGPGLVSGPQSFLLSVWPRTEDLREACLWLTRFAGGAVHWDGGDVFPSGDMTTPRHATSPRHLCGQPPWTHSTRLHRKPVSARTQPQGHESASPNPPLPLGDRETGLPHQALGPRNHSEGRECVDVECPQTRPQTRTLLPAACAVALTHPEDMAAELAHAGEGLCLLAPCCPWPGRAWELQGRTWSLSLWEPPHAE